MNEQLAREYWTSMTHVEKLFFIVSNGSAASFAHERLQMHRNAAHMQMARIREAIAASKLTPPKPESCTTQGQMRAYVRDGTRRMQPVFTEVHFYFVCWSGCRNMLQILVGQPEFLEAKKVFDSYRKEFEHYVAGRNSFEHYHGRLPGQSEAHRVKEVQSDPPAGPHRIFAGFSDGKYVHSSLEWDISPTSLARLEKYVGDVLFVIDEKIDQEFIRKGIAV